jgi:hypothetical protein
MNIKAVATELIGIPGAPTPFFQDHFQEYEQEFLDAACALGYPVALWPSGEPFIAAHIHIAKREGRLPVTIPTTQAMKHDTYTGSKQHELVTHDFNRQFSIMPKAVFVVTGREDWWPHAPAFLAHDADSFMLYCLYTRARNNKDVLVEQRKQGRPRNNAAHAAKTERSERYQQWLAECEVYRTRSNELKDAYMNALDEYTAWKEQGAPKWIP